jgi:PRTRC genetic system protein B
MKDLTNTFGNLYHPVKALLVMQKNDNSRQSDYYIESYDMDRQGCPINGHPLSVKESNALAKALQVNEKKSQSFLVPQGLMPKNILHLTSSSTGYAVWHTPAQRMKLLFSENLGIPSGMVSIPALVWKAGRNGLGIYALQEEVLSVNTPLFNAPFFNIYPDGRVCMGNVQVRIPKDCGLEQFITLWQDYFFNSYFSHLLQGQQPVKGNIIQLWQNLTATQEPFPTDVLTATRYQIKNLIP